MVSIMNNYRKLLICNNLLHTKEKEHQVCSFFCVEKWELLWYAICRLVGGIVWITLIKHYIFHFTARRT